MTPLAAWQSFDAFGLHFQFTDQADDGVLASFFPAYNESFVLANEKEQVEGFRRCLALNHGVVHQNLLERYGPFVELVAVARNTPEGPVVGGANLLVTLLPDSSIDTPHAADYGVNLNYLFVDRAHRGRGLACDIQRACARVADALARSWRNSTSAPRSLTVIEVNDPFRLTPQQYTADSSHAGIDQVTRLHYWAQRGAAVLDWPYVQPALSGRQDDDDTLALAVLAPGAHVLAAASLLAHLQRFFAISVLKGQAMESAVSATRQLDRLAVLAKADAHLSLFSLAEGLPRLREQLKAADGARPTSLSQALREASR